MDLAKLVVRLEAQSAQLLTELERANNRIDKFASKTQKTLNKWAGNLVGAFSARAIYNFTDSVLDAQGQLDGIAQKTGTTVEQISSLGYAASQSESDLESLAGGLKKLSNTATDAAKGTKSAEEAFGALGISVEDGNGKLKGTEELLLEIADAMSQYEDGAAKTALAQDLFGKSGADLIPFLNQGREGIEKLTDEADRLGITVSGTAAKAADEFQDNLAKLGAVMRGAVGRALAELTPALSNLTEQFTKTAVEGGTLQHVATVLATAIRLLVSAGLIVGEVFDRIGSAIGNTVAQIGMVMRGEFKAAIKTGVDYWSDSADSIGQTAAEIGAIWSDQTKAIVETAVEADKEIKKTLILGGNTDGLQEVKVGLDKSALSGMEKFYADLNEMTKTAREQSLGGIEAQRLALEELVAAGKISADEYVARMEEINKARSDALGITKLQEDAEARLKATMEEGKQVYESTRTPLEQYNAQLVKLSNLQSQGAIDQETYNRAVANAQEAFDKATDGAKTFADEAKRNLQDILGQGIYDTLKDGFDKGAGAALDSFADMLLRMATEAIAADITGALFGNKDSSGGSSGGGWVNTAVGLLTSAFGGGRAMGGPVNAGVPYNVGENGPEVFVPDRPGRVEDWSRKKTQQNNIYVTVEAPKGSVSRATQMQTGSAIAKQIGRANSRNG